MTTLEITGDIEKDFRTEIVDSPCRCGRCDRFIQRGERLVWLPDSVQFSWNHDSYEDLVEAARNSSHSMGFCIRCVEKSKGGLSWVAATGTEWWFFLPLIFFLAGVFGFMLGTMLSK